MQGLRIPTGFRFKPSKEQLIGYYLFNKIHGREGLPSDSVVVPYCDLYSEEPWKIYEDYGGKNGRSLFFITPLKKKKETDSRIQRKIGNDAGTWHGQNLNDSFEVKVEDFGIIKASKRRFTFKKTGSVQSGCWGMMEYSSSLSDEIVVCELINTGNRDAKLGGKRKNPMIHERGNTKMDVKRMRVCEANQNPTESFNPSSGCGEPTIMLREADSGLVQDESSGLSYLLTADDNRVGGGALDCGCALSNSANDFSSQTASCFADEGADDGATTTKGCYYSIYASDAGLAAEENGELVTESFNSSSGPFQDDSGGLSHLLTVDDNGVGEGGFGYGCPLSNSVYDLNPQTASCSSDGVGDFGATTGFSNWVLEGNENTPETAPSSMEYIGMAAEENGEEDCVGQFLDRLNFDDCWEGANSLGF